MPDKSARYLDSAAKVVLGIVGGCYFLFDYALFRLACRFTEAPLLVRRNPLPTALRSQRSGNRSRLPTVRR
jgi:hypothetical protein